MTDAAKTTIPYHDIARVQRELTEAQNSMELGAKIRSTIGHSRVGKYLKVCMTDSGNDTLLITSQADIDNLPREAVDAFITTIAEHHIAKGKAKFKEIEGKYGFKVDVDS